MASYRGELASSHPTFPEGSAAAACNESTKPVNLGASRINYSEEDDEAINDFIRKTGTLFLSHSELFGSYCYGPVKTTFHSVR
jgi:hypothetical protein